MCGLANDEKGSVKCFGHLFGMGNLNNKKTFTPSNDRAKFIQISVGKTQVCAVTNFGETECFGPNMQKEKLISQRANQEV